MSLFDRRIEKGDLLLLGAALAATLAGWILWFGWRPGDLPGSDDLLTMVPLAQHLGGAGNLYRADVLGGTREHDAGGAWPLLWLLAQAGVPVPAAIAAFAFAAQAAFGFLAARATLDLAGLLRGDDAEARPGARLALATLFPFLPILAWRVSYGHLVYVTAPLLLAGVLALALAARRGTLGALLAGVAAAGIAHGLLGTGQQILVYAAVFGLPFALALPWPPGGARACLRERWRGHAAALLVLAGTVLLCLPSFLGMLDYAAGGDAARAVGRETVAWSYTTATWRDWASSIPLGFQVVASDRPVALRHETNYPIGPWLLALALLARGRGRWLAAALAAGGALAIGFAAGPSPLSDALLAVVPVLGAFRVPARAMLPLVVALSVAGAAWLVANTDRPRNKGDLAALALAAACLVLPPLPRELVLWAVVAAALAGGLARVPEAARRWLPGAASALAVAAAAGVAAFGERNLPFVRADAADAPALAGEAVRAAEPSLASPLTRAALAAELPDYRTVTAAAAGVSSVSGYSLPLRRFSRLVSGLEGRPFDPTRNHFAIERASPASPVLRALYNVAYEVSSDGAAPVVRPLGATAGQAWFPERTRRLRSFEDVTGALAARAGDATAAVRAEALLAGDDAAAAALDVAPEGGCGGLAARRVHAAPDGALALEVDPPARACLLAVAMNWASTLRAAAGDSAPLQTGPVFGALLGIVVPARTTQVTVRAVPAAPAVASAAPWAGLLALAGAALLLRARPARVGPAPTEATRRATPEGPAPDVPEIRVAERVARWLPPAALLAVAWVCAQPLSDSDTGFHLALGRLVSQGTIPRTNALAWTAADHPWYATSWLYDLCLHALVRWLGAAGAQLLAFALVVAAAAGLRAALRAVADPQRDRAWLDVALALGLLLLVPRAGSRSYLASWVVLAWTLALVLREGDGGWKRRAAAVPLIALGGNLHTGAAFGAAVLALFCAQAAWRERAWLREGAIALAGVGALLANPGGPALVADLFAHLFVGELVSLAEYRPPQLAQEAPFFLLAALALPAAWLERRRWPLGAATLVFLVLGVRSVRFCYEFHLLALPLLLAAALRLRGSLRPVAAAAALATALLAVAVALPILGQASPSPRFRDDGLPVRAAGFLEREGIAGRGYNAYHDGGYLAWALGRPVFQDPRPRAYPAGFWREQFEAETSPAAFRAWLGKLDVEWAATAAYPTALTGNGLLHGADGWALVYWDEVNEVFLRRDVERFRPIIERLEYRLWRKDRTPAQIDAALRGAGPDELARFDAEVDRFRRDSPDHAVGLYARCLLDLRLGRPLADHCEGVR